jgi:hypothetical protein
MFLRMSVSPLTLLAKDWRLLPLIIEEYILLLLFEDCTIAIFAPESQRKGRIFFEAK